MKELIELIMKDKVVTANDFFVPSKDDLDFIESLNKDFIFAEDDFDKQTNT